MADIHPQTSSPFFQLPAEIREKIQRYTLTENNLLTATRPAEFREAIFRINGADSLPAIMATCKKMYLEMRAFAFTEMVVLFTSISIDIMPRIGVLSHGNLRHERIRRISFVVHNPPRRREFFDTPNMQGVVSPKWAYFLHSLLIRCTEVDRLDFEFGEDNVFREELEAMLADSKEKLANGTGEALDEVAVRLFSMPNWVKEVAENPSLRRVYFEGNVAPIWLESLRRTSEGRIQVFRNGVRVKEEEVPLASVADMEDPLQEVKEEEVKDPQIQFVYESASRFDQQ
ncbi:hypothetical protein F5X68DRAFT_210275 [Plectosphaerella plurivora]|uniref:Uncharacterized protein n=1 Tax=Plectosphaerella plurivora TaxID=936078 RepID=A0A9P8V9T1_9PEZI|nr:hypothetical protein F5X68DRAFT_210275 [Plectosphaerella plurivora]